ncbi:50S ribosomal protein L18e [Candidatus Woesearchaeota archaeon]|nr:50S ribosomal protein L18e [Candidatus Woesearchaeota archaeon]
MKRTGPTNQHLQALIADLKRQSYAHQVHLWRRLADDLEMPTRQRRVINVNKLNRFTKANEVVVVPGKVLGTGSINHNITVAAWQFSEQAKAEIERAKGKCLSIQDLLKQNPKAQKVRLMG